MNRLFENENAGHVSFPCDSVLSFFKIGKALGSCHFFFWPTLQNNIWVFVLQSFFTPSQKAMGTPRQTLQVLQPSAVNTDLGRSAQVCSSLLQKSFDLGVYLAYVLHRMNYLCRPGPIIESVASVFKQPMFFLFSLVRLFPNGNSGVQNKLEVQRGWR